MQNVKGEEVKAKLGCIPCLFTCRDKYALDGYVAIHPFGWNGEGAILGDICLLE